MELPPSDAAADIRRTNVEREATYLEFARLEAAAKRRVAQRARVVRDALASTPALAHELERRGVVDDDAALGKLASGLMAAPLSDPPEGTAEVDKTSAHDVADVLREMYGGRRAEHGGIAGELAARRKQLEKRQRDLLRERDRLAEHERVHALTLEERRKVEAAQEEEKERVLRERNARAASGTASSSDSSSSSDDESEYSNANMARAKADARAKAKASTVSPGGKLQRQGGHKGRSRSFKMSQTERIKAQQDALRPTQVIAPRRVDPNPWDAASESSAASDATATSPFALPEVPKETLAHGDREALVRRLQKELGVTPTQRVAAFVPTRAKDRLLRMKLAHSSVAARLKYLESAASYEKELRDGEKELREDATAVAARDVAEYAARLDDTREVSVKTVEQMCRELALEMCGAVADVLAERPTKEKLAFEKQEWIQRAGPRRLAMCRQTLDDLVREVAREEAMGVVLEVEANHAAAAGFVAKAIAGAVMARLDGDAAAELKPWAPPPPPPSAGPGGAKEAGKGASGGWLWTSKTPAEKAKAKAAKEKAKAEKMAAAKEKKAARAAAAAAKKAARKNTRWSLFGGSKPKQRTAVPEEDEAIDFHARLNARRRALLRGVLVHELVRRRRRLRVRHRRREARVPAHAQRDAAPAAAGLGVPPHAAAAPGLAAARDRARRGGQHQLQGDEARRRRRRRRRELVGERQREQFQRFQRFRLGLGSRRREAARRGGVGEAAPRRRGGSEGQDATAAEERRREPGRPGGAAAALAGAPRRAGGGAAVLARGARRARFRREGSAHDDRGEEGRGDLHGDGEVRARAGARRRDLPG